MLVSQGCASFRGRDFDLRFWRSEFWKLASAIRIKTEVSLKADLTDLILNNRELFISIKSTGRKHVFFIDSESIFGRGNILIDI